MDDEFLRTIEKEGDMSFREQKEVEERIKKVSNFVGFTAIQVLRPYPGGEIYGQCLKYGLYEPKTLSEWETFGRSSFGYFDIKDAPWIKEKDIVDVVSKYTSRGLNNYVLTLKISPLIKFFFFLRSAFYWKLSYAYVSSQTKIYRKLLKRLLENVTFVHDSFRPFFLRRLEFLKNYR